MIKIKALEGHYTIKRVVELPKRGNSNWLYTLEKDNLTVYYFINLKGEFEKISLSDSISVSVQEGDHIVITGTGAETDPYVINAIPETAQETPVEPKGGIIATNVQDALEELKNDVNNSPDSTSVITETVLGNKIATHSDGKTNNTDINETITGIKEEEGLVTYTKEGGEEDTFTIPISTKDIQNEGADNTSVYVEDKDITEIARTGLSIRDTNNNELFKTKHILQIKGIQPDSVNKRLTVLPLSPNTVFVKTEGNDSTAVEGSPDFPFKTLGAALLYKRNNPNVNVIEVIDGEEYTSTVPIPPGELIIKSNLPCTLNLNQVSNFVELTNDQLSLRVIVIDIKKGTLRIKPVSQTYYGTNLGTQRQNIEIMCRNLDVSNIYFSNMKTVKVKVTGVAVMNGNIFGCLYPGYSSEFIFNRIESSSNTNLLRFLEASNSRHLLIFNTIVSTSTFVIANNVEDLTIEHGSFESTGGMYINRMQRSSIEYKNAVVKGPVYIGDFNQLSQIYTTGKVVYEDSTEIFKAPNKESKIVFDTITFIAENANMVSGRAAYISFEVNNSYIHVGGVMYNRLSNLGDVGPGAQSQPTYAFNGHNVVKTNLPDDSEIFLGENFDILQPFININGALVSNGAISSEFTINKMKANSL